MTCCWHLIMVGIEDWRDFATATCSELSGRSAECTQCRKPRVNLIWVYTSLAAFSLHKYNIRYPRMTRRRLTWAVLVAGPKEYGIPDDGAVVGTRP